MTSREDHLVTTADPSEVVAAIEGVDLGAPWAEVAPDLRIALPRRRPLPPGTSGLLTREFPPGIRAGLGLDIGPAMLFISDEQLSGWGVTTHQAFDQALANVSACVRHRSQFALLHQTIAEVPTKAFQSREGWASTLLLLPDELTRVFGERDGLLLAPMRDLTLLMPLGTEYALARFVLEEFAAADMNALDLPPFALIDGRVTVAMDTDSATLGGSAMH